MALNPQFSTLALTTKANAGVDAMGVLLNGGVLDLYDGTQPATANAAVTTQVKLARLTFGTPAFGAAVGGVAAANAITPDAAADASGTASWCRALKADGTTVVFDGSVGTSSANLNLSSVSIVAGVMVSVSAFTLTDTI